MGYAKGIIAQQYQQSYAHWASAQNPAAKILHGFNTNFYWLADLLVPDQEEMAVNISMGPTMGAMGYLEKRGSYLSKGIAKEINVALKHLPNPYEGVRSLSNFLKNSEISRMERLNIVG
jgi:hypothetical protein